MEFENPFAGDNNQSFLGKFTGGVSDFFGGASTSEVMKHPIVLILGTIVILLLLFLLLKYVFTGAAFGNGRLVGSGCGRYNQLQRAVQFELPLSQPELDSFEAAKQSAAGMPYMSQWNPPMENVYSGFGDKKVDPKVETYQLRPSYPEGGFQEQFNDNVLKNIAYD